MIVNPRGAIKLYSRNIFWLVHMYVLHIFWKSNLYKFSFFNLGEIIYNTQYWYALQINWLIGRIAFLEIFSKCLKKIL